AERWDAHQHPGRDCTRARDTSADYRAGEFDGRGSRGKHALLNHLVSPLEERLRDRQAKRFGSLEVDHQLELRRLLDRQFTRLRAFQDLVHIQYTAARRGMSKVLG